MKKILFTLLAFVGFSSVFADDYDYPYLTIVTSGGTVKSVAASSLVLTISGGQLVAVNDNGNQTFTLTALSKMYFSKTDETATGSQVANGLAFSVSEATATLGEDFTEPTLTNPYELTLTWDSSDENVATVDEDGEVTLVAAGATTITASYAGSDDYLAGEISYTLTVEKADPVANGLAFSVSGATATLGEDFTEPTLTNPYKLTLTWASSDENVATVDEDGEVALVAAGATTITASYVGSDDYLAGEVSYTLTVEKADPVANGLAFSVSEATATLGEDFTEPTLTNPYKLTLTWASSDENVATVDEDGEVTLVAAGATTITASYVGSDDYLAGEVSYTLTVEKADAIPDLFAGSEVDVYTISGSHIGRFASIAQARAKLKRGLYVVRSNYKSFKLSIK